MDTKYYNLRYEWNHQYEVPLSYIMSQYSFGRTIVSEACRRGQTGHRPRASKDWNYKNV